MNRKNLMLALMCSAFMLSACSDDEEEFNPMSQNVPENVLKAFRETYGNVDNVKWEVKNDYHVARFQSNPLTKAENLFFTTAWFNQEGGQCQVDQHINYQDLPAEVKAAFDLYKETFYADWQLDECEVVHRDGMGMIYVVELEKGKEQRELSFSVKGDLLKDCLDDDEDVLPVVVPEEVHALLAKLFPESKDLSLLEVEVDDNEIELDILDNARHKEVKLSPSYEWISTEYEVSLDEAELMMKPEVMNKLVDYATQAGVDLSDPNVLKELEIKAIDHALKGLSFDVEIEIAGKDIELNIDKDGNILLG